jgi:hypothetical protein
MGKNVKNFYKRLKAEVKKESPQNGGSVIRQGMRGN